MVHHFDHEDALAVAAVERAAVPAAYTTVEGGVWTEPPLPPSGIHSIWFMNGEQWDEHNGWRGHAFDQPFAKSLIGALRD